MSIKNYSELYFQAQKTDTDSDVLLKNYLHKCVITHCTETMNNVNKNIQVVPVIKELDLTVKHGDLIGIKGNVGSGKSSLFSCILGEMKATDVKNA